MGLTSERFSVKHSSATTLGESSKHDSSPKIQDVQNARDVILKEKTHEQYTYYPDHQKEANYPDNFDADAPAKQAHAANACGNNPGPEWSWGLCGDL